MAKDFQTKYDEANGKIQKKIENIFDDFGLLTQFENDCNKAFKKLPEDIQKRIEEIISKEI